jgi:hypothetical protein
LLFRFQEIVPLNARNIFGAEDTHPVAVWEHIIRETLNRSCPEKSRFKHHSDPPPSRSGPSDYDLAVEDDLHSDSESNNDEGGELHPLIKKDTTVIYKSGANGQTSEHPPSTSNGRIQKLKDFSSTPSRNTVDHSHDLGYEKLKCDTSEPTNQKKSASVNALASSASLKSTDESFSFTDFSEDDLACDVRINDRINRKRPEFVRIISKQMVGILYSIWVRRSLWKHIQNLRVSTVGVGVMGYIGNKASVKFRIFPFLLVQLGIKMIKIILG